MIPTLEDFIQNNPKLIKNLFNNLNLNLPELIGIKEKLKSNEILEASNLLLKYYKEYSINSRIPQITIDKIHRIEDTTEDLLNGIMNGPLGKYYQKRFEDGNIDWSWLGPQNEKEWAYHVNRHMFLYVLANDYRQSKNENIVKFTNNLLYDWITNIKAPKIKTNRVTWRGMEAGLRIMIGWPLIFYNFQNSKSFSDVSKILMLNSIILHGKYLRKWHAFMGNHLITQMKALAVLACAWPEIKYSKSWIKYSKKKMEREINHRQVYPDGIQKENSTHVHMITLIHFEDFADIMKFNKTPVSPNYYTKLEKMWNYIITNLKPNGEYSLNNDTWIENYNSLFGKIASKYDRNDWKYILSGGKYGEIPSDLPSKFFPWGGQAIMRNKWGNDSNWSFFDFGPSGTSPTHLHKDKLHFSLNIAGTDFLVDSGSYHHQRDKWRNLYFNASRGHNVILVDGCGQNAPERSRKKSVNSYISTKDYDFIVSSYNGGFANDRIGVACTSGKKIKGKAAHIRIIIYEHNKFWLVIDKIITNRPREIEALWHFHPNVNLTIKDQCITASSSNITLNMLLHSVKKWNLEIQKGLESPKIQGWWTDKYDSKFPSPCVVSHVNIIKDNSFAWLISKIDGQFDKYSVIDYSENDGFVNISVIEDNTKSKYIYKISMNFNKKKDIDELFERTVY